MTDSLHLKLAAQAGDDVVRRMVPGFVDEEDPLHFSCLK